ncbi:MAG: flavin-nucleotide-binding protein [Blastocatellia bacterium AA13]|nr:MAG: flavin-nucleotide-binding protein [Blastocatellia bacterium AA13]
MIKTLSPEDARSLLERCRIGRLGCITGNEPYVVPISYLFEDDSVYGHTMPGLKVDALRANPRACVQVDEIRDGYHWRSAIGFGGYEEIKDPEERERLLTKLLERFPQLTPAESISANSGLFAPPIVFRIRLERMTGLAED